MVLRPALKSGGLNPPPQTHADIVHNPAGGTVLLFLAVSLRNYRVLTRWSFLDSLAGCVSTAGTYIVQSSGSTGSDPDTRPLVLRRAPATASPTDAKPSPLSLRRRYHLPRTPPSRVSDLAPCRHTASFVWRPGRVRPDVEDASPHHYLRYTT